MTDINDLLARIPMDQVASQLGVDEQTADHASRLALPALLDGMRANAQDPAGAASLGAALGEHDPSFLEGGIDVGKVDTTDGDKIVSNVFGRNRDDVITKLGSTGTDGSVIGRLLPMLAPLLMAFLAKQSGASAAGAGAASGSGGLGDLLGGMLGGSGGQSGGGGLGDLLGGLLGAGKR